MSSGLFDTIAKAYNSSVPPVPDSYIDLFQETFQIKPGDRVVDLGCGSGKLALRFANKSCIVEGIDASEVMITEAKKNDKKKQVTWTYANVDSFDLGEDKYNLIYSFESFHLFPNKKELIKRCASALKPGGFLCVGWAMYEWDEILKDIIIETFASFDINRGEWGLWTCPTFKENIESLDIGLSDPVKKEVSIKAHTLVSGIIDYIFSNSKSASLKKDLKPKIAEALKKRFLEIYPTGESNGYAKYTIMYSQKQVI